MAQPVSRATYRGEPSSNTPSSTGPQGSSSNSGTGSTWCRIPTRPVLYCFTNDAVPARFDSIRMSRDPGFTGLTLRFSSTSLDSRGATAVLESSVSQYQPPSVKPLISIVAS